MSPALKAFASLGAACFVAALVSVALSIETCQSLDVPSLWLFRAFYLAVVGLIIMAVAIEVHKRSQEDRDQ